RLNGTGAVTAMGFIVAWFAGFIILAALSVRSTAEKILAAGSGWPRPRGAAFRAPGTRELWCSGCSHAPTITVAGWPFTRISCVELMEKPLLANSLSTTAAVFLDVTTTNRPFGLCRTLLKLF